MDIKTLDKYIAKKQALNVRQRLQKLYFFGENPEIYRARAKEDPDNRIPIPFARRITLMYKGYIGKPGNIKYSGKVYEDYLKPIYWENNEELTTSELLESCLIHGTAYEIHWMENNTPMFAICPIEQGIPIMSADLKPRLEYFIRVFEGDDDIDRADVYGSEIIEHYYKKAGAWILESEEPHGYKMAPVNLYQIDSHMKNIFDHIIPLIDAHDKLISEDVVNELERYAQSLLALNFSIDDVTEDENGLTEVDKIKYSRMIQNVQGKISEAIQYITKPPVDNFINTAADREERLIYENAMVLNPNDPNWGNASGETAKWKTWPFELMAASIEAYFSIGLYRRAIMIENALRSIGRAIPEDDISISFIRNLPKNIKEIAETAVIAESIIGRENSIKMFPTDIVPDVQKVLNENPGVDFSNVQ